MAVKQQPGASHDNRSKQYLPLALFIGGERIEKTERGFLTVLNPATETKIGSLPMAGQAELGAAVAAAARGFAIWSATSPLERSNVLREAARLIRQRIDELASALTLEQGKVLSLARGEWNSTAEALEWAADEGRRTYGRVIPSRNNATLQTVVKRPVGPVAAFSPWNFPAWTSISKIAPALAAGCSVVAKGAEETPATILLIAQALYDAGLPPDVLSVLFGNPPEISDFLISSPVIRKISFTGSVPIGRELAAKAGRHLKRATMELGGHSPVIVCSDADVVRAAQLGVIAKYRNAGQVCVSPTRFLVQRDIFDQFLDIFAAGAAALKVGEGLDPLSEMGPLANDRRLSAMEDFMSDALQSGARVVTGGHRLNRPGYFFQPTVLADVPIDARVMREEPFGPIALVNRFSELDEALAEANRLDVGLASYCFTDSDKTQSLVKRSIQSGMLAINHYQVALSETPFGGTKDSGFGNEGGTEGIDAYLESFYVTHLAA
jgi:succinate-semialdehyde dehydrogenase / glutarate-semialdehyde dehydrogenase